MAEDLAPSEIDPIREGLEEQLRSIRLIRTGVIAGSMVFDMNTLEKSDFIDRANVDAVEAEFREAYAGVYPDLFPTDTSAI